MTVLSLIVPVWQSAEFTHSLKTNLRGKFGAFQSQRMFNHDVIGKMRIHRKFLVFFSMVLMIGGLVYLSLFQSATLSFFSWPSLSHQIPTEIPADEVFTESTKRGYRKKKFDRRPSYPWKGDPKCQHFVVQLADEDSLPKWPLTSFPGSGVTWTRQLIEGVTGIYTGSVYMMDPPPVRTSPVKGNSSDEYEEAADDPMCGCTILDKDHEATILASYNLAGYFHMLYRAGHAGIVHQQYDKKGVLLLRNPMDVVFTFRHWIHGGKTGTAPPEAFQGPEWDKVVDYVAYVWADHAMRWIEQISNGTVIFYEKLMGETADEELERLFKAIDFQPVDPDRMRCALAHRNRTDHKRVSSSKKLLEPAHRIKLMESIHRVQQTLRRKGWPRLPVYLYDLHSPTGAM